MKVILKSERFSSPAKSGNAKFFINNDVKVKRVIKQVKDRKNNVFRYYLCSPVALDADDNYVYSSGEFIGSSPNDLKHSDVFI